MAAELTLAEPLKSRLILEMAADLEAMAEHFRTRGMTEAEAAAAAEERLLASPQVLEALVRVHTTGFERAAARVAWALRSGGDLVLFVFGTGPLVAGGVLAVTGQLGAGPPSPGVSGILGLGLLVLALVGRVGLRMRGGWAERRRAADALTTVLLLSVGTAIVGAAAFVAGIRGVLISLARSTDGPDAVLGAAAQLTGDATLLTLSLLVALAGAFSWFVLTNRIAVAEQAESAALLYD